METEKEVLKTAIVQGKNDVQLHINIPKEIVKILKIKKGNTAIIHLRRRKIEIEFKKC